MFKGSMVAIVTPMNEDGSLDHESLEGLIEFHINNQTDVIISVGTTGESATLNFKEHSEVIKSTLSFVNKRIPVVAGSGANSTSEAIELTERSKDLGADGCLLVTPYYNKPTQNGLYEHYKKIADEVSIPQILYNVPGRTSVDMLPETVHRLSTHPNIVAIKEASGNLDRSKELIEKCADNISIFTGDDKTSVRDILLGFKGNISVTANIVPLEMHNMCKLAMEGKAEEANKINSKIDILHDNLFIESNPIPVKWALHRMGLIKKGIRLPLTWLDEKYEEILEKSLHNSDIILKNK
ncbi:MAG: 4-hydroxy-tetrahydrodipicolinate synthase [Gammaproteobacteria bacterium]|jgi:4-hydroxy-tetrahydrodipicolinate synthase|nr:4-hydroxy-tetrahydrodipicolinate synthase [Gammaproteobacteria bacterium]MBT4462648.1 4-hydroxy-tetrahydrodipicolinate synthase [Gammaproteobacteria bacterium]MBT4654895.1 4-hydroxy-tetrahydrodipicolinate synthase [Gammaproteobacteria bacterium]MBT5116605.1 4-hydroxy-tetrahydrodipicolinate synthase [Gammaproteobacteria bacterium]MBT5761768.1 4-hydroxy-tetrahydrodipicolinate synthase [Gammaproteobacteria bacterium]